MTGVQTCALPICREAKIGCTDCKRELAEALIKYLEKLQGRRKQLKSAPHLIQNILASGCERARDVASATLKEAQEAMGIKAGWL